MTGPKRLCLLSVAASAGARAVAAELQLLSELQKRAASSVYKTLYSLVVQYMQVAGTISAAPAATFWTDSAFFSWLQYLTFDMFSLRRFQIQSVSLETQMQLALMLAPCACIYWLS